MGDASKIEHYDRSGIAFINLGSLLAQIIQIAGYPTLLSLALSRVDYPSWIIGIIVSLQWIVVLVFASLVPGILLRVGPRLTCQAGVALSMLALAMLMLSSQMSVIALSSLLMGLGLTMRWVACDTWIVESAPEHLRGRAVGIHETLMGLGIAIGPVLTMLSNGSETVALLGFMALLALACLSFGYGSTVATWDAAHHKAEGGNRRIAKAFRILLLALLAAMVAGYIETAMVALLPIHLMQFSYPEAQALLFLSLFGLGGTLLQTPLGWVADRWSFRTGQIVCAVLIFVGGLLLILSINLPFVIMIALFIWGGCVGGLNTLAVIEAGATLKQGLSGTGMALIASSYTLGGVIGPVVSGSALGLAHGHGAIAMVLVLITIYGLTIVTRSGSGN